MPIKLVKFSYSFWTLSFLYGLPHTELDSDYEQLSLIQFGLGQQPHCSKSHLMMFAFKVILYSITLSFHKLVYLPVVTSASWMMNFSGMAVWLYSSWVGFSKSPGNFYLTLFPFKLIVKITSSSWYTSPLVNVKYLENSVYHNLSTILYLDLLILNHRSVTNRADGSENI